jgi:hypothetical protein
MVVKRIPADTISHKYSTTARPTLKSAPKPTNYGLIFDDYEDILSFYHRVKQDPDLKSQMIALLESEWRPAVQAAIQRFYERTCCSKCLSISETGEIKKKLTPAGKRRLDTVIIEMRKFPVEQLSLRRLRKFRTRLGWLEKEYLDANVGKICGGLA